MSAKWHNGTLGLAGQARTAGQRGMNYGTMVTCSGILGRDCLIEPLAFRVESTCRRKIYTVTPTQSGFIFDANPATASRRKLILNGIELSESVLILWHRLCLDCVTANGAN